MAPLGKEKLLSDIAAKVKEVDFPSPAIIVVGEVASLELTD